MNVRARPSVFAPVDKAAFRRFVAAEPEGRYEFEGGRIVQQMAGTLVHYRLARRISRMIEDQVDGTMWYVFTDAGIETAQTIRYGDVVMAPVGESGDQLWTTAPALIVEVLSPSSIARDLDRKPSEYLTLPSLQAYIVASQSEAACRAWVRNVDGAFPATPADVGAGETIAVPALGLTLAIDHIYRGIDLLPALPGAEG